MNEAFPTGIAFDEALAILRATASGRCPAPERLALSRCHGRVLAEGPQPHQAGDVVEVLP